MAAGETQLQADESAAIRDEWQGRVNDLAGRVESWAQAAGWRTRRIRKWLSERRLEVYEVPVVLMERDTVQVVLNPVARFVPGSEGAVDLYLAPAYEDVATLYLESGRWVIHYGDWPDGHAAEGVTEIAPRPLDKSNLQAILDGMSRRG